MRLRKIILSLLLTLTLTPTVVSYAKKGSKKKPTNKQAARYHKALSDLNRNMAQLDSLLGTTLTGEKKKKAQKQGPVNTESGADQSSKAAMN